MSDLSNNENENDTNHEQSLLPSNLFNDDDTMDNTINVDDNNLQRTSTVSSSTSSSSSLGLLNNDVIESSLNPSSLTEPQSGNPHQVNNESTFNIPDPYTGISSIYLEYRNNIINNLLNRGRIRLHNSRIIDTDSNSNRSQRTDSNVEESLMRNIHVGGDYHIGGVPVSWNSDIENTSSYWGTHLDELRNIQVFNSLTPPSVEHAISNGILNRSADEDWSHYLNVLRDYVFNSSPTPRWERINMENAEPLEQPTNGFKGSATTPSNWPITWNPAHIFDGLELDEQIQAEQEAAGDGAQIAPEQTSSDMIQSNYTNATPLEEELETPNDMNMFLRELLLFNLNHLLEGSSQRTSPEADSREDNNID